jgi:flagellar basal body-associated protein FliL
VHFKLTSGSSALITIILMLIIVSVAAFGFLYFVTKSNEQAASVINDSVNLTGISYTSEIYNGTNLTISGLANVMPNFIWIVVIFLFVVFFTLFVIALKKH